MDYGIDKTNGAWRALRRVAGENVYNPRPGEDVYNPRPSAKYYEAMLGKREPSEGKDGDKP
jgi:hypothetical protein